MFLLSFPEVEFDSFRSLNYGISQNQELEKFVTYRNIKRTGNNHERSDNRENGRGYVKEYPFEYCGKDNLHK